MALLVRSTEYGKGGKRGGKGVRAPPPAGARDPQRRRRAFIAFRDRLMNAAYFSSSIPKEGASGISRCWATVWASVYLRMPSEAVAAAEPGVLHAAHRGLHAAVRGAYPSLMLTVPVRSRAATAWPRRESFVQTEELRPYGVALASSTTSSSSVKR